MKVLLIILFVYLCFVNSLSSDDLPPGELFINNLSSNYVKIKVYPVGAVFNGNKNYSLKCVNPSPPNIPNPYIVGCEIENVAPLNGKIALNHDSGEAEDDLDGAIGYGKYRIDFYYWNGLVWELGNYCYVDFSDSDYPYSPGPWNMQNDISIFYHWNHSITYYGSNPIPTDKVVKIWDQTFLNNNSKTPNKNGFKTTSSENGLWLNFTQNATDYGAPYHIDPGTCFVKFDVLNTHEGSLVCGKSFELKESLFFRLNGTGSTKFYVGNTDNNNSCNSLFTVNSNSAVILHAGSEFIVRNGSVLYMNNNTNVRFYAGAKMTIRQGGKLCVNGSVGFLGPGVLDVDGIMSKNCTEPINTSPFFEDSVTVKLDVLSSWIIPDSTTLLFKGNETRLICDSGSTIKFGKGSKLILEEGARINARYTKFVSYDSTEVWDGIYMEDYAYDTLKNCTFENAYNGLNITDIYNPFGSPSAVEISNCSFKNSSSTVIFLTWFM